MIFYLVCAGNTHTVTRDKAVYRGAQLFSPLEKIIQVVPYHELFEQKKLIPGTYLFSDLECMNPSEFRNAKRLWQLMVRQEQDIRTLNCPGKTLTRFDLLRKLNEAGINDFNVYRLSESHAVKRYPVFVRRADDHAGNTSPLIHNEKDLNDYVRHLQETDSEHDNKIIIELVDSSENGIYKKYSAYIVGNQIIPRHVLCETQWMVKTIDLPRQELIDNWLKEEHDYIDTNPHEEVLKEVAQLTNVQYGRVDYGLLNGRPQIWEINTNPMLFSLEKSVVPFRPTIQERFFHRFVSVMEELNHSPEGMEPLVNPFASKIRNRRRINWALDLCLRPLGLKNRRKELVRGLRHRLSAQPSISVMETEKRRDYATLSKKEL